jgi:hypothetical protein
MRAPLYRTYGVCTTWKSVSYDLGYSLARSRHLFLSGRTPGSLTIDPRSNIEPARLAVVETSLLDYGGYENPSLVDLILKIVIE